MPPDPPSGSRLQHLRTPHLYYPCYGNDMMKDHSQLLRQNCGTFPTYHQNIDSLDSLKKNLKTFLFKNHLS